MPSVLHLQDEAKKIFYPLTDKMYFFNTHLGERNQVSYIYIDQATGRQVNRYMIEIQTNVKIWSVSPNHFCLNERIFLV